MREMNKKDAHEFLTNLVQKIKESDKKEVDARPILYFIQEQIQLTAADGRGEDGTWYVYENDSELCFDDYKKLKEFLSANEDYSEDDFEKVSYQNVWDTQQLAFLTRESCQAHIDMNHYHYTKPRTYSRGVWRDPLMEGLFKALHTLYGDNDG